MTFIYGETFSVDLAHADAAYSLFDFWKAMGKNPHLATDNKLATVYYYKTNITIDKESDNELPDYEQYPAC